MKGVRGVLGVLGVLLAVLEVRAVQQVPPRDARPAAANATGRITGVVVSDEARPRPLRRARVTLLGQPLNMPGAAITRDDGSFTFDGLPAGRYTVSATKDAYVPMAYGATRTGRSGNPVQIADGQSATVTIRLPRGAVVTGTVVDVDGQPAPGVSVTVLSRRFAVAPTGDFRYLNSGSPTNATTDDRGVYRVYGVPAGDYIVAAQLPPAAIALIPGAEGRVVRMMSRGAASAKRMLLAQVYHPGVSDLGRATRVTVRAGEERTADIQLEYVPLAAVSGTASFPPGFGPARVTLWRTDESARPQSGPVATVDGQGRFQFPSVAPGHYRLAARATAGQPPPGGLPSAAASAAQGGRGAVPAGEVQYASADVVVNGEDVEVALATQTGLSISGRVAFETDGGAAPALPVQLRVTPQAFLAPANGGWPMPPIEVDGAGFKIEGIIPGPYRVGAALQGVRNPVGRWWLKSIVLGGRDILDSPLELTQSVTDAVVTFSDRASVVEGTLKDAHGVSAAELFVVVLPSDRAFWFTNSRRIVGVRPGRDATWSIRNLPPGDYRVAYADLDQNEWFDPAVLERLLPAAIPVTITGSERKSLELSVK